MPLIFGVFSIAREAYSFHRSRIGSTVVKITSGTNALKWDRRRSTRSHLGEPEAWVHDWQCILMREFHVVFQQWWQKTLRRMGHRIALRYWRWWYACTA